MLPVGVGKNKNSRGRKKNGHHGHYFGGLVGKKNFSTKIPNIINTIFYRKIHSSAV